jgi:hypothetical protein
MELFNNLKETFDEINYIQRKIDLLRIYENLPQLSNIKICFESGQKSYNIMQLDTDISLVHELKLIIHESIELYENQIQELKLNF